MIAISDEARFDAREALLKQRVGAYTGAATAEEMDQADKDVSTVIEALLDHIQPEPADTWI